MHITRTCMYILHIYRHSRTNIICFDHHLFLFFGSTINDKSKPTSKCCLLQNPSCRRPWFISGLFYRPVVFTRVIDRLSAAPYVHGGLVELLVVLHCVIENLNLCFAGRVVCQIIKCRHDMRFRNIICCCPSPTKPYTE